MITSLILMIAARLLMLTFGTFAFIYVHIKFTARAIKRGNIAHLRDKLKEYYHQLAFADDQKGNVLCRDVFNDWFLRNKLGRKEYGSPDLTVSHVTGVNEHKGMLTFWGRLLAGILNAIDEDHTTKARDNEQFNG